MTLSGIPASALLAAAKLPENRASRALLERAAAQSGPEPSPAPPESPFVPLASSDVVEGVQEGIATGESVTLYLPEPPSLNAMLDMAKERKRVGKRLLPVVYSRKKSAYEHGAYVAMLAQGFAPPDEPWRAWAVDSVLLRRHQLLDPIEALASLKWPIDALVKFGYVAGDSLRSLLSIPIPQQVIDRKDRGLTLVIRRVSSPH